MLLRSELQTALQDVEVSCLEVADGHDGAADLLEDDPLAPVLRELASARRAAAARLGDCIRQLDDLPAEPDADLETARELATRLKAALTGDQREIILEERTAAEAHLMTLADAALGQADLPSDARALLEQIRHDAANAQQGLANA